MPTAHRYEIFINAPRERVWAALVEPAFTQEYFYGTRFEAEWAPGAGFRCVIADGGRLAVEGTVEVAEPPARLVYTWHILYDAALADEPPGRVEWELADANPEGTVTRVTLRHGDLALSPLTWEHVRLGWVGVLDNLKSLLETGAAMPEFATQRDGELAPDARAVVGSWHRTQAVDAHNAAMGLLAGTQRDDTLIARLLALAYAAEYHWSLAQGRAPINAARAAWLVSRAHLAAGDLTAALRNARRCARLTQEAEEGASDFDHAYAHEALARSLAAAGDAAAARAERDLALAVSVADPEDRAILEADLAAGPWFGLAEEPQ